ncbi:hypothetical protein ACLB2K_040778 [Fragaria x ananassa]
MTSQGSKGVSGKEEQGLMTRLSESKIAETAKGLVEKTKELAYDMSLWTTKALKSMGKGAWISGTSNLILVLPLIIVTQREHDLINAESAYGILVPQ